MTWDGEKSRGDELTSSEWNDHVADQKGHSERHGSGGIDEISVEGLSGDLADDQDPKEGVTRDIVEVFLDGGNNVTVSRSADTLTIDTSALNDQEVADKVGAVVEGGTQTTVSYDSGTQTATITIDAPSQSEFDNHSERHEKGGSDELTNFGDTTHDLVSTGDLDIDGADFVAKGDVICVGNWGPPSERTASTTSTTFTIAGGFSSMLPIWDGLIPAGGTPVIGMTVRFNPGDGETMTGAYINNDEAVEMVSVTGESGSGSQEWSGWVEYEPADTATPTDVVFEHKVDTGLNTSTSIHPTLYLGVQL